MAWTLTAVRKGQYSTWAMEFHVLVDCTALI